MSGVLDRGALIEGRYALRKQRLGDGPELVFDGVDRRTGSPVEIRVVPPSSDEATRQRFGRFAQSVARLDHPGCLRGHCTGSTADGAMYLVVDPVGPARLSRRVGGSLDPFHVADIGAQLLRALEHARGQGVRIGPLRPEDIEERVEGARIVVRIVQFDGAASDSESVLVIAGALLRHLTSGNERRLLADDATPFPLASTAAVEWLDVCLDRLVVDDPEERFESTAAAAEALEQWCRENAGAAVPPPPAAVPAVPAFRTSPTLRTMAVQSRSRRPALRAAVVVGGLAVVATSVWFGLRPHAVVPSDVAPASVIGDASDRDAVEPTPPKAIQVATPAAPPAVDVEPPAVDAEVQPAVAEPPALDDDPPPPSEATAPRTRTKPTAQKPAGPVRVATPMDQPPRAPASAPTPEERPRKSVATPLPDDVKTPSF